MKKITLFISVFFAGFLFINSSSAQHKGLCGQAEAEEKIRIENPELYKQILHDTEELEKFIKANAAEKSNARGVVYVIPVVFHIIHNYGIENISDAQVYDAIKVLNEDFRKLNADTGDITAAFKSVASDSEIEFRLAQKDPAGNCTNGIVRVASPETYKGNNSWSDRSTSDLSRWPRDKYLNIWVVNTIEMESSVSGGYIAGYTYRPGSVNSSSASVMDGITIMHRHVGSIGTSTWDNSRTLTHEVGHWINLAHTWGNSNSPGDTTANCPMDDGVADTPNTAGWFSGCDLNGTSCGTLDNIQNYMDYGDCPNMFTEGQSARMRSALEASTAQRNNLWSSANLIATGTDGGNQLCKADFKVTQTEICAGGTVDFMDYSYNNPSGWEWTFTGGTPSTSLDQNPSVVYSTPGIYNVQLTVTDGSSSVSETKNGYITVLSTDGIVPSFVEGFESTLSLPNNLLFVNNSGSEYTWELSNVGATGSKSVMLDNSNAVSSFGELSSTTIDLSSLSAVHVSFKVAFAQKSSSNSDKLKFFISKDCGESWIERWEKSGSYLATVPAQTSDFIPSESSHWQQFLITNIPSSYLVNNFKFKFQFAGDGGNNIFIDDINVYDPATVGINKELSPSSGNFVVFPNPFKEETRVTVTLHKNEQVKLSVMDLLGKESVIQPQTDLTAGEYIYRINKSEMKLSKGIYFIKLTQGDKVTVKKAVLN